MKESTLVRKIIAEVKRLFPRCRVVKHSDRFRRGDPDLQILFPRHDAYGRCNVIGVLFVETKRPAGDGVVSYIQQNEIDAIRRVVGLHGGCWAIVADTVDEVIGALAKMGCVT